MTRLFVHTFIYYWPFWPGPTERPLEAQGGPCCSSTPSHHLGPLPSQPQRPPGVLPHHRNSWSNGPRATNIQAVPPLRQTFRNEADHSHPSPEERVSSAVYHEYDTFVPSINSWICLAPCVFQLLWGLLVLCCALLCRFYPQLPWLFNQRAGRPKTSSGTFQAPVKVECNSSTLTEANSTKTVDSVNELFAWDTKTF